MPAIRKNNPFGVLLDRAERVLFLFFWPWLVITVTCKNIFDAPGLQKEFKDWDMCVAVFKSYKWGRPLRRPPACWKLPFTFENCMGIQTAKYKNINASELQSLGVLLPKSRMRVSRPDISPYFSALNGVFCRSAQWSSPIVCRLQQIGIIGRL